MLIAALGLILAGVFTIAILRFRSRLEPSHA